MCVILLANTRDYGFNLFTFSVVWQLVGATEMWLTRLREKEKDRWRKKGNRKGETDRQTDIETQRFVPNTGRQQSVCTSPRFQYHCRYIITHLQLLNNQCHQLSLTATQISQNSPSGRAAQLAGW